MLIKRSLIPRIQKTLDETKKGVVIYGPRQVGKTTLANEIIRQYPEKKALS